jgi:hypothetical protein
MTRVYLACVEVQLELHSSLDHLCRTLDKSNLVMKVVMTRKDGLYSGGVPEPYIEASGTVGLTRAKLRAVLGYKRSCTYQHLVISQKLQLTESISSVGPFTDIH